MAPGQMLANVTVESGIFDQPVTEVRVEPEKVGAAHGNKSVTM
jgi:hypothetical protein